MEPRQIPAQSCRAAARMAAVAAATAAVLAAGLAAVQLATTERQAERQGQAPDPAVSGQPDDWHTMATGWPVELTGDAAPAEGCVHDSQVCRADGSGCVGERRGIGRRTGGQGCLPEQDGNLWHPEGGSRLRTDACLPASGPRQEERLETYRSAGGGGAEDGHECGERPDTGARATSEGHGELPAQAGSADISARCPARIASGSSPSTGADAGTATTWATGTAAAVWRTADQCATTAASSCSTAAMGAGHYPTAADAAAATAAASHSLATRADAGSYLMAAATPAASPNHCTAAADNSTDALAMAGVRITDQPAHSAAISSARCGPHSDDARTGCTCTGIAGSRPTSGNAAGSSSAGGPRGRAHSKAGCSPGGREESGNGESSSGNGVSVGYGNGCSGEIDDSGGATGTPTTAGTTSSDCGTGSSSCGNSCSRKHSSCGGCASSRKTSSCNCSCKRGGAEPDEERSATPHGQCAQSVAHHREARPRRGAAEDGHLPHQERYNWSWWTRRRGRRDNGIRSGGYWRRKCWSTGSPGTHCNRPYHSARRGWRWRTRSQRSSRRPDQPRRRCSCGFSRTSAGIHWQLTSTRRRSRIRFNPRAECHEVHSTWEDPVFNKITSDNDGMLRHPLDTHNIGEDPEVAQTGPYHGALRLHTEYYRLPRKHKAVDKFMKKVRLHVPYHNKSISRYDIFTDGSAADDEAAWGFVVFAVHERKDGPPFHTLCGYLGGRVPAQLTQDALTGEIWALAMAKCWWYERCDAFGWHKAKFRVDNQAALKVAEGHSALPDRHPAAQTEGVRQDLRRHACGHPAAQVLAHIQRLLPPQLVDWEHVKAHSSVAGNEMADIIAGTARENSDWFYECNQRLEPFIYDDQLHTKYLSRVHVFRNVEYANFDEDIEKPYATMDITDMAKDMKRAQVDYEHDHAPSYNLQVASINVRSALDKNGASNNLGLNISKRSEQLRLEYEKAGYDIIGMQETRTSGPTSRANASYHVHCSGRQEGPGGNYGCEIWVSKTFTKQDGIDVTLTANSIKMVLAEPRMLMVSLTAPGLSMDIVCLHAPCRGPSTQEAVSSFWDDATQKVLARRRSRIPLLVLMDANCEMGTDGVHTGDLVKTIEDDHPIFDFLKANDVYLPHTFTGNNAQGELQPTFYGTEQPTCLDYVGLSMGHWDNVTAEVAHDVDVSLSNIDHIPAVVRMATQSRANKLYKNRRQLPYDIDAIRSSDNRAKVKTVLQSVQPIPWYVEPSSHYHCLAKEICAKLAKVFPRKRKKARPWWMAAATRLCLDKKRASFVKLLRLRREGAQRELIAQAHAAHKNHVRALRRRVRTDQRDGITEVQKQVADSLCDGDLKTAFQKLKQMIPYRTPPSNMVLDELGRPVKDQQEASEVWMRHWARTLSGKITSFKDSIVSHINMWFASETSNCVTQVPTPDAIGYEVSQAKPKAHGEDLIHADVWKCCPGIAGRILHPLVCKCSIFGAEPYLWAGDCRIGIPKPGKPATNPANLRGVALQCSAAKAYHKEARRGLADSVKAAVPDTTYGGIAGRSSEAAIHMQVQFCEHARRTGSSAAVVFIDLTAAFDKTRRCDLPEALPDSRQANTVIAAHRSAWLSTQYADSVCIIPDGLKQGDPIADISFVSVMQLAVDQMQSEFHELGLQVSIEHGARGGFFTYRGRPARPQAARERTPFDESEQPYGDAEKVETKLGSIVYIDDLSLLIKADKADELVGKVNTAATIATDRLRDRGFEVNFSVGKTECTYILQGQHARKVKTDLYQSGNAITLGKGDVLRMVPSYKHLGCKHSFKGAGAMIAKQAADAFTYTMHTLTAPMLKNPLLQLEHKKFLAEISLSRALYASAAWPILTPGNYRTMEKGYNKMIRMMSDAGWKHDRSPTSNKEMAKLGFNSLATHLRTRRLRYAARMCTHGAPQLAALLARNHEDHQADEQSEMSWYAQLIRDFSWLKKASTKLEEMPEPTHDLSAWKRLMTNYPRAWKDIVGLAHRQVTGTELDWSSDHRSLLCEDEFCCKDCGIFYRDWQGYQLHRKKKHGREAPTRRYAPPGHQCCSCGTTYAHRSRLLQHWKAGFERHGPGSCFGQILILNRSPQPDEVVERLEEEERQRRAANRRRGWHPDKTDIPAIKDRNFDSEEIHHGPLPRRAYE
eukprot:TRINITY_DN1875_c0_g5_i2.p1 TRINITY_DN1875_c0_g5~~TRINITY_DN1875_c0_g5_i2.p1  ORF type:complete len:2146 (+),score=299.27 TRINITY_DN1875_c0_g5_i2:310-6747(+)